MTTRIRIDFAAKHLLGTELDRLLGVSSLHFLLRRFSRRSLVFFVLLRRRRRAVCVYVFLFFSLSLSLRLAVSCGAALYLWRPPALWCALLLSRFSCCHPIFYCFSLSVSRSLAPSAPTATPLSVPLQRGNVTRPGSKLRMCFLLEMTWKSSHFF